MKEEMIDVLDENGIPTGEVLSRTEIHAKGHWHETILICVINSKNEILMQKRANHKVFGGKWDLTVAGHLNAGSFAMDTLFAEMMEEIGFVIPQGTYIRDLKHLKSFRDSRVVAKDFIENQFMNLYIVHVDIDIANINLQDEEVEQVKWCSIFDVKKLAQKGDCHPRTAWIDFVYKYISRLAFR